MAHLPYEISPALARATDQLLRAAIDALEAGGADFAAEYAAQHSVVVPGSYMHAVHEALAQWNIVSCAQGACESWTQPQARAAQDVFKAVDHIFDLSQDFFDVTSDARVPVPVFGARLARLMEVSDAWVSARQPSPKMRPK